MTHPTFTVPLEIGGTIEYSFLVTNFGSTGCLEPNGRKLTLVTTVAGSPAASRPASTNPRFD